MIRFALKELTQVTVSLNIIQIDFFQQVMKIENYYKTTLKFAQDSHCTISSERSFAAQDPRAHLNPL